MQHQARVEFVLEAYLRSTKPWAPATFFLFPKSWLKALLVNPPQLDMFLAALESLHLDNHTYHRLTHSDRLNLDLS